MLDASGTELLSCKVENDEDDLSKLIDDALFLAEEVVWTVDQPAKAALPCAWHCCGNETSGCSTFPASLWTGPATSTAASRRPMPASLLTPGPHEDRSRRARAR